MVKVLKKFPPPKAISSSETGWMFEGTLEEKLVYASVVSPLTVVVVSRYKSPVVVKNRELIIFVGLLRLGIGQEAC